MKKVIRTDKPDSGTKPAHPSEPCTPSTADLPKEPPANPRKEPAPIVPPGQSEPKPVTPPKEPPTKMPHKTSTSARD